MARPKKLPMPVRLEVHYEHVRDRRVWPAITILAAMYRDDVEQPGNEPVEAAVEPAAERIAAEASLAYNVESPA